MVLPDLLYPAHRTDQDSAHAHVLLVQKEETVRYHSSMVVAETAIWRIENPTSMDADADADDDDDDAVIHLGGQSSITHSHSLTGHRQPPSTASY